MPATRQPGASLFSIVIGYGTKRFSKNLEAALIRCAASLLRLAHKGPLLPYCGNLRPTSRWRLSICSRRREISFRDFRWSSQEVFSVFPINYGWTEVHPPAGPAGSVTRLV